ncbi:hypothetical protein MMC14_006165 [Varicellaria rhodocarpa]|nr:hypothetical protein [Varicellaria rhodocarpa]
MDLKEKGINLSEGRDCVFNTTSPTIIYEAAARVLTHHEQTKNRAIYVQDTATMLKKLAAMGKKVTGVDE